MLTGVRPVFVLNSRLVRIQISAFDAALSVVHIALLRHRHGVLGCRLLGLQLAVRQVRLYRNVVGRNVLVDSELSLLGGSGA